MLIRQASKGCLSPMLPKASFEADVILVAPREFEVTRAQRTYREKNFTTFTELLSINSFQTDYIKRINEALGLEALASYLRGADIKVAIINCNVAPHTAAEVAEKVRNSKARVVGISLIYRPQVAFALELLEELAEVPDVQVCMGGALASFMPRELLTTLKRLDAVIYGEAEETFRDYCLRVLGRQSWQSTPGLAFRDGAQVIGAHPAQLLPVLTLNSHGYGEGWRSLPGVAFRQDDQVILNPPAAPLELESVLTPARDTLTYLQATGWPTRIASIYTSRGCMAKCTFCTGKDAYNVERVRTYRFRDPKQIVDEIQYLRDCFGVRFVYINDDNFLGYGKKSYDRVRAIAEDLLERNLGIQFATECRVDGLDIELLRLLKQAGMRQVLLGIESGSDSALKRWRKGATVEQNRQAIETVNQAGVSLEPGFILFDAHTTREELSENVQFIRDTGLDRTSMPTYLINRLSVYPGTEIEQLLTADGTIDPSPIVYADQVINDPQAVINYFQRLEYVCRDPRTEIAWRSLRRVLEPVEIFLEDHLPTLTAVLTECRSFADSKEAHDEVRQLIRKAALWRRKIGDLITRFIDICVHSYDINGHAAQMRWLHLELRQAREQYSEATLGTSTDEFTERVLQLRRRVIPVDVSVIIPTAGKWSRLHRTLAGLGRQVLSIPLRWEIILVLDGVTPPSGMELRAGNVPLQVVSLAQRSGRSAARNAGIAKSKAEILILLDDDIIVGENFVQNHFNEQRRRACLCHGPVREIPGLVYLEDIDQLSISPELEGRSSEQRIKSWAERVLAHLDDFDYCWDQFGSPSRLEKDGLAALAEGRVIGAWVAFAGANLSAPRKWFLEDGFDERPGVRWGLEDITLALRWAMAGRPLGVAEKARGLHLTHHRPNWKQAQRENLFCLDFIPENAARAVLSYLEGEANLESLEEKLEGCIKRPKQSAQPVA